MQIDFHHAVTYVLARLAGFNYEQANIIAYSSQYVDDSNCDVFVKFNNGALYKPICSAHKILDYRNFDQLADHLVWVPFHFLPGNNGLLNSKGQEDDFISRIICRPNSYVAQDLVAECIRNCEKENSLHRLGITLHVYADTWAHQGFAGIQDDVNLVKYLEDDETSQTLTGKIAEFFQDKFDREQSRFVAGVSPLGHGAVLSYPDRPYLKWKYEDNYGNKIERNNPLDFLNAAQNMYKVMKRFLWADPFAEVPNMDEQDSKQLAQLLQNLTSPDGIVRHQEWLKRIREGEFRFGPEEVHYDENEWINTALGSYLEKFPIEKLEYEPNFLDTDWKKFQDALIDHHYYLLRVLLPNYDICIA